MLEEEKKRRPLKETFYLSLKQPSTQNFSSDVTDGRLRFWLSPYAQPNDQYFIDNVALEEVASAQAPASPGNLRVR